MSDQPKASINGRWVVLDKTMFIADVVRDLGYGEEQRGIAVAVNDHVIARRGWNAHVVAAGDRIEVVVAVQGG